MAAVGAGPGDGTPDDGGSGTPGASGSSGEGIRPLRPRERRGAVLRMGIAVAAGVVVGVASGFVGGVAWGVLCGLAVQSGWFAVGTWAALWPADASRTAAHARREELRPALEELVVLAFVVAGVSVTLLLGLVGPGSQRAAAAVLALAVVLLQWFGLHAMYAARYAFEYYDGRQGGIDFNQPEDPAYRDFLYFSYNLGMTYQVSDTSVTSTRIRAVVLRHCLISFLLSLVILATTVNIVTGVFTGGL